MAAAAAQNGARGSPAVNGGLGERAAHLAPHFIGGNHLNAAAPGKVKDFVAAHDGHSVITNVSGAFGCGEQMLQSLTWAMRNRC